MRENPRVKIYIVTYTVQHGDNIQLTPTPNWKQLGQTAATEGKRMWTCFGGVEGKEHGSVHYVHANKERTTTIKE